jgi:DNA-binding CsgD family transcriptional regulator
MKSLSEYEKEWKATFAFHECYPTAELISEWEIEKKIILQRSRNQNSSYTVFDMHSSCIVLHLSARTEWMNPILVFTDCADNFRVFLNATHPQDRSFALETEIMGYDTLMSIPVKERKRFKMKYYRRFRGKSEDYVCCVLIISVLKFDNKGCPWLMEIETEHMPLKYHPEESKFREFSHKLKGITEKPALKHLSKREKEILNMNNEGFTNNEIAEKLGISAITVRNIRGNILKKLNVSTIQMAYTVATRLKML